MKTIEAIINEIKASEALQKKLAEAVRNNTVADFLKEQGCETTAGEFIAAVKDQATELSDEKLATVTGGANLTEALLSVMSVGIGCAVEKGFQGGGDRLRAAGINLKSLAIIESADPGNVVFRDDN